MSLPNHITHARAPAAILAAGLTSSAALAATWTVCPDGSGNFTTIQAAIDAAAPGDDVVLCSAIFTGAGNRDIDFTGKAITVESMTGNPADCIIDCQGQGRGFLFVSDEGPDSVLRGVTIMDASAGTSGVLSVGAGIRCGKPGFPPLTPEHHGSPTIEDCVITGCIANYGAGIACTYESAPILDNCVFVGNEPSFSIMFDHYGAGMYCHDSSPSLTNCVFAENAAGTVTADRGGGVYCEKTPGFPTCAPTFNNCIFTGNEAALGGALYSYSASPYFDDCTFAQNVAGNGAALYYSGGTSFPNEVYDSTFYGNSAAGTGGVIACVTYADLNVWCSIITMSPAGCAVNEMTNGVVQIGCCDIYGNDGGPGDVADQIGSNNNFAAHPRFCDPLASNFTLHNLSPCAPANSPCGALIGAWPVGCSGPLTFTVCPDGTGNFTTIQAAIDAAAKGDTVELCDGTYTGVGNRDLDFGGKAITVISASGDPANCIIDCQGSATNPHRGFHFYSGELGDSLLACVTITNGYIVGSGGAILCEGGSSPTILLCNLTGNHAVGTGGAGGAIACTDGSSPIIEDCLISENTSDSHGGGMICSATSNPHLIFCTFSGNAAQDDGGGLAAFGQILVETCRFEHNTTIVHGGGATFMGDAAGSEVVYTVFTENHATLPNWGAGGGISSYTNGVNFDHCTFDGNTAVSEGGGAYINDPTLFTNCTFNANSAPVGGGLWGNPTLDHSIIAFSTLGGAVAIGGTIVNCDVYGNVGGPGSVAGQLGFMGNFSLDPMFCGAASQVHHLTICDISPCAPANSPSGQLIGAWLVDCVCQIPDEVHPPPWRGWPRTTMQRWLFGNGAQPQIPEIVNNPYGTPTLDLGGSDWMASYEGRQGVVYRPSSGALQFQVPNDPQGGETKWLWIQLTYWNFIPAEWEVFWTGGWWGWQDPPLVERVDHGNNWFTDVVWLTIDQNPPDETLEIWFGDPNGGYVDEVVIDTRCLTCPWDSTGPGGVPDGAVDVQDLLELLSEWGCVPPSASDVNGDGCVDVQDLLALLAGWGACP